MGNTTLSAYIVDSYPSHANEVITFYTVWINVSPLVSSKRERTDSIRCRLSSFRGLYIRGSRAPVGRLLLRYAFSDLYRLHAFVCSSSHYLYVRLDPSLHATSQVWFAAPCIAANVHEARGKSGWSGSCAGGGLHQRVVCGCREEVIANLLTVSAVLVIIL